MISVPEFNDKEITKTLNSIPDYRTMPEEFRFPYGKNVFMKIVSGWFFSGLDKKTSEKIKPKEGIDKKEALAVIRGILGSWSLKHEDKTCKSAYLMNEWFTFEEEKVKKGIVSRMLSKTD